MTGQSPSLAGRFESAAQQMLEALQRGSAELTQSINDCIDELNAYNLSLQKSLADQLQQAGERFQAFAQNNQDELESRKDQVLEKLVLFEREQIDSVVKAAQDVRQSLSQHARECEEAVSHLVGEQLEELEKLLANPQKQLTASAERAVSALSDARSQAVSELEEAGALSEGALIEETKNLEADLQKLVEDFKQRIQSAVDRAQESFRTRAAGLQAELDRLLSESLSELGQEAEKGRSALLDSLGAGGSAAAQAVSTWKGEIDALYSAFTQSLQVKCDGDLTGERNELELKLKEAGDGLAGQLSDARDRVQSVHKAAHNSLRRSEQDYQRRIDALIARFDTTISELSRRCMSAASAEQRSSRELINALKSQLATRAGEITAGIEKFARQLEVEYARSSQGGEEQVELISGSAVESLEKQVQVMKNDLKKVSKGFQDELDDLERELAEIELAGKKAAETIMTYRSAMLSLGGE